MSRTIQKVGAGAVLALGLAMAVWGGRDFLRNEPAPPATTAENLGPRMCPPTIGELLDLGPATHKFVSLVVAVTGSLTVCGSALFLAHKEQQPR